MENKSTTTTTLTESTNITSLIYHGWLSWKKIAWPTGFFLLFFGFVLPHFALIYGTSRLAVERADDIQNWMQIAGHHKNVFELLQIFLAFTGQWLIMICVLFIFIYWSTLVYQQLVRKPKLHVITAYKVTTSIGMLRDLFLLLVFASLAVIGSWLVVPMLLFGSVALLVPIISTQKPHLSFLNLFRQALGLRFRKETVSYWGGLFALMSLTCCFYLVHGLLLTANAYLQHIFKLTFSSGEPCSALVFPFCNWGLFLVEVLVIAISYFIFLILQGSLRYFYIKLKQG